MLLTKQIQKTLTVQLCVSFSSLTSLLLHSALLGWEWGWRYMSPFYLSKKYIKSSWLDEKFTEESRISSLSYSFCLLYPTVSAICLYFLNLGSDFQTPFPVLLVLLCLIPRHHLDPEAGPSSVLHTCFWLLSVICIHSQLSWYQETGPQKSTHKVWSWCRKEC